MAGGRYTEGSVFRHVSGLSITSAIGLFAIFVVDLVDVFFISILGEPELAAAVGFAGVGLFFGAAICIGLAIAISTTVAQSIGSAASGGSAACDVAEAGEARRLATHGLLLSLCLTVPLTVLSVVYARELLALTGAQGRPLDLAVGYFRIVGASLPILGLAMAATSLLRATGDGTRSMWSTIIAGLVNAVLDPLFIFGLSLGLSGAAAASVLSRCTVAGIALAAVMKRHGLIGRPVASRFFGDARELAGIAVPSLITNLSTPIGSAWVTSRLAGTSIAHWSPECSREDTRETRSDAARTECRAVAEAPSPMSVRGLCRRHDDWRSILSVRFTLDAMHSRFTSQSLHFAGVRA